MPNVSKCPYSQIHECSPTGSVYTRPFNVSEDINKHLIILNGQVLHSSETYILYTLKLFVVENLILLDGIEFK